MGSVFLVGIGPGNISNMTSHAVAVISLCNVICGYDKYVAMLGDMVSKKQVVTTGMRGEKERCHEALKLASEGHRVALVCSGDAGIYGMAGLVYEMMSGYGQQDDAGGHTGKYAGITVEVVPGVTAATSGAALLGAPLMNDFAVISLSDQLTPWERIEQRLSAVASADMVMVLYNPMSHHRPDTLKMACDIVLKSRRPDTVCGWVRNIGRDGQEAHITTLDKLRDEKLDMLCTVFIGASDTRLIDGRMVTVRGYDLG